MLAPSALAADTAHKAGREELLAALQVALACQFPELEEQCLSLLADKLAGAGEQWEAAVQQGGLADLPSTTLMCLRGKMEETRPPWVFDVRSGRGGAGGSGFTFAIPAFSKRQEVIISPWVEVGGFEWRLHVFPQGRKQGWGTHLAGDWETKAASEDAQVVCPLGLLSQP